MDLFFSYEQKKRELLKAAELLRNEILDLIKQRDVLKKQVALLYFQQNSKAKIINKATLDINNLFEATEKAKKDISVWRAGEGEILAREVEEAARRIGVKEAQIAQKEADLQKKAADVALQSTNLEKLISSTSIKEKLLVANLRRSKTKLDELSRKKGENENLRLRLVSKNNDIDKIEDEIKDKRDGVLNEELRLKNLTGELLKDKKILENTIYSEKKEIEIIRDEINKKKKEIEVRTVRLENREHALRSTLEDARRKGVAV